MQGAGGTEERAPRGCRTSRWGTRVSAAGGALARQDWPETGDVAQKELKGTPGTALPVHPCHPCWPLLQPPSALQGKEPGAAVGASGGVGLSRKSGRHQERRGENPGTREEGGEGAPREAEGARGRGAEPRPPRPPRPSTSQGVPSRSWDPPRPPPAGPGSAGSGICRIRVCGTRTRGTKVCGARVRGVEFSAPSLRMAGVRGARRRSLRRVGRTEARREAARRAGGDPRLPLPPPRGRPRARPPPPPSPCVAAGKFAPTPIWQRREDERSPAPDPSAPGGRRGAKPTPEQRRAVSTWAAAPRGRSGVDPVGTETAGRARRGRGRGERGAGRAVSGVRAGALLSPVRHPRSQPRLGHHPVLHRRAGPGVSAPPPFSGPGGRGWGRGCRWPPGALRRPHCSSHTPHSGPRAPPPWGAHKAPRRRPRGSGSHQRCLPSVGSCPEDCTVAPARPRMG